MVQLTKRNPLLSLINEYLIDSPAPINLSYFWSFGSLLGLNLVVLIVSGITLAMHYTGNTLLAFQSVEHIMRDVNNGWLLRSIHANGASMFFIWVYLHIGRNLFYGSYRYPRGMLWTIGVIIFIAMMATAFIGYVLPWGILYYIIILNWPSLFMLNLIGFPAIPVKRGNAVRKFILGFILYYLVLFHFKLLYSVFISSSYLAILSNLLVGLFYCLALVIMPIFLLVLLGSLLFSVFN